MRGKRAWKWLPIAAGVVLAVAAGAIVSMHHPSDPHPTGAGREMRDAKIETMAHAEGFVPLPRGAITVVSRKEKQ